MFFPVPSLLLYLSLALLSLSLLHQFLLSLSPLLPLSLSFLSTLSLATLIPISLPIIVIIHSIFGRTSSSAMPMLVTGWYLSTQQLSC